MDLWQQQLREARASLESLEAQLPELEKVAQALVHSQRLRRG